MAKHTEKDRQMAAMLRDQGIFHGKRTTHTMAPVIPVNETGSAAYRRLVNKKAK